MPDFLLEIGTEEIPARMMNSAWQEMTRRVLDLLTNQSLFTIEQATERVGDPEAGGIGFFLSATPRRLALVVPGISAFQPDVTEQMLGPSTKVAYKDGQPTPAAEAFAKKAGVDVSRLEKVTNSKGEYLAATVTRKGRKAAEILGEALPKEISGLYWAKNMYWRSGKPERFVRPVRWIVAMLDGEVVPLEFAGIKAGQFSRGHRILGPEHVAVATPMQYVEALRNAHVMVPYGEREHRIRKALDAATRTVPGARWREDAELLKTVVNLTEWPSAILGNFDKQYLSLPEEVLVTVMRDHQKYFAVEDAEGKLAPHFLAVLNTDGDPDGLIRHGNERVLRARFNDARFFWDTDQKTPLVNRVEMLKAVTFQKDLGSYAAKSERTAKLAEKLCAALAKSGLKVDGGAVQQAARLAKTDLTAELVKEFTELQGIVGGLYAKAQGLPQSVADAIYDQYKPGSTEDSAPRTLEGAVLSIADKADTVVGMFGLGLIPSGSKDPFALRRQANGIIKTLAQHELAAGLSDIIGAAVDQYASHSKTDFGPPEYYKKRLKHVLSGFAPSGDGLSHADVIAGFFVERLQFYLRDVRGFAYDVTNSVLAVGADDVMDAVARAEAVKQIRASEDFAPLFVAFKRIKGIVNQARDRGFEIGVFTTMSGSQKEIEVLNQIQAIGEAYLPNRKSRRYLDAFRELAKLRRPIDMYFDAVRVMVDDPEVRSNRLGVLNYLLETFNTIADLSELVVEAK